MDKILESLIASGPLALVMGFACKMLWSALTEERAARAADAKAAQDRRDADQTRHDAEVNGLRAEAAAERARHDADMKAASREYVDTVKELTGAVKEAPHA